MPETTADAARVVRAPRGAELHCKSWLTEAPFRMIQNNLDPDVAEHPESLVVYGGIGRAARNWECFDKILETLRRLEADETLLVQSGKPVGVFKTHEDAPRVLIANSNLVPKWATWEHFHELDKAGLMMYGQMTAGSWIYIATQGIIQGTYETFGSVARKHFGGDAAGKWILTGGLGGMGGAQPLAATMAGFSMIAVECDETRIDFRHRTRYVDEKTKTLDEALAILERAKAAGKPVSVGLLGNAADVFPELVTRGIVPDVVTDQTSAHDPINGYLPKGWTVERWRERQESDPQSIVKPAKESMAVQVRAMLDLMHAGSATLDYGNNIRQMAKDEGVEDAFDFPGFVPAYIRPLFCKGYGPFRWVALSGDPEDIYKTDAKVKELIPDDPHLHQWLDMARERIAFQGLPARICWVGVKDRHRLGVAFNEMVKSGELSAPVVIGRDHLDTGSVASPNRETESMKDGSDAVSDWPLLNAMLNTAGGATWVSLHHGGGVGMGYSQHAGVVIVCDGTDAASKRLSRVLFNDPASGVMRHADAGYEDAAEAARDAGLDLPMLARGDRATSEGLLMSERVAPPLLLRNVRIATMTGDGYGEVGADGDGFVLVRDGVIAAVGVEADLPSGLVDVKELGCEGAWVTPGLIDCHTHLVFGGQRADEFERRLEGVSYEQIAREGGGIRSTVRATRAASVDELVAQGACRLDDLVCEGVTTVEIKSGYGLNLESERNMLLAARALEETFPVSVATTFLGAHAVPEEYDGRPDDYIEYLIATVMPALHGEGLVDAVDAFCETIGFTAEQVDRLFTAARKLGLPVKLHAEQLSDQGGAQLLARHGGLSADHLEYVSDEGVRALAESDAVAVLLPGAFYFLRETKVPPIDAFRAAGVPMAISTDCNPGSSPLVSPLMTMNLACVQFRMTPSEALRGMTVNAARALGMADRGTVAVGRRADLAAWDVERPGHLAYEMGAVPLRDIVSGGDLVI